MFCFSKSSPYGLENKSYCYDLQWGSHSCQPIEIIIKSFTQKVFEFDVLWNENTGIRLVQQRDLQITASCAKIRISIFSTFNFFSHSASELFSSPKGNRSLRNFQSWIRLIPSVLRPDKWWRWYVKLNKRISMWLTVKRKTTKSSAVRRIKSTNLNR